MEPLRRCPECGFELLPDESMCRMCHAEAVEKDERPRRRADLSALKVLGVMAILIIATFAASMAFDGIYRAPPDSKVELTDGSWDNYTGLMPPPRREYIIVEVTVTSEFDEKVTVFIDMFRLKMESGVDYGVFPGIEGNFTNDLQPGQSVTILIGFSIDDDEVPDMLTFEGLGQYMELELSRAEL